MPFVPMIVGRKARLLPSPSSAWSLLQAFGMLMTPSSFHRDRSGSINRPVTRSAHHAADQVQRVLAGDLANRRVLVPPRDQATDDVLAVGRGLQAVQVRGRKLAIGHATVERRLMEADMIPDHRVRADADVVD